MRKLILAILLYSSTVMAATATNDYLVKFKATAHNNYEVQLQGFLPAGSQVEDLGFQQWVRVQVPKNHFTTMSVNTLANHPDIEYIQPNYPIRLLENPALARLQAKRPMADDNCPIPIPGFCDDGGDDGGAFPGNPDDDDCPIPIPGFCDNDGGSSPGNPGNNTGDNPAIPVSKSSGSGPDPLLNKQWGMNDIGAPAAWNVHRGSPDMIVAVIDTGVDYTHEDLVENLWRNPGETGLDSQGRDKATNGVDDDGNGYVDDVIGWDFVSNDNKPYDLKGNLFSGGNPGHGTHCAGNIAATGNNGKGISGVAPNVKIMVLRFISDQGGGTTADAVKAIRYAVDNGARITSNSWGSEGEDPNAAAENKALRDAITYAQSKNTLFIAAAGNGHQGIGYDNDTDSRPAFPASYDHENIISVAALDSSDRLGSFSNWGRRTVDIGAPGVKVFSTVVGNGYTDTVMPILGATWDGTSMAAPHVAGAAALYWSAHPEKTWDQVKAAILGSAKPISALSNKSVSGGKLNVQSLMNF